MFNYTSEDYAVMERNDWPVEYVNQTLEDYCFDYELTLYDISTILQVYGVNELFDSIPIACEDFYNMMGE